MLSSRTLALSLATAGMLAASSWMAMYPPWVWPFGQSSLPSNVPGQQGANERIPAPNDIPTGTVSGAIEAASEALAAATGGPLIKSDEKGADLLPDFDVVRIEPNGEAVVAGRGLPGATLELLRGDHVLARIVIDQSGHFVVLPQPLPPGDHILRLRSTLANGSVATSQRSVAFSVTGKRENAPVAESPAALDKFPPPRPKPPSRGNNTQIAIESLRIENGALFVTGRAPSDAVVRLHLNETYLGVASASNDGRFSFSVAGGLTSGQYRVRIDQIVRSSGEVVSRTEKSFSVPAVAASLIPNVQSSTSRLLDSQTAPAAEDAGGSASSSHPNEELLDSASYTEGRTASAAASQPVTGVVQIPAIETARVTRGDSLWRISRHAYGQGVRYTLIYDANRDQIRTPNRIYPGQVFVLPNRRSPPSH